MKIERPAYMQQLIESKDNGLIKIVTGLRRVGKSYLLKTLFKGYLLKEGLEIDARCSPVWMTIGGLLFEIAICR